MTLSRWTISCLACLLATLGGCGDDPPPATAPAPPRRLRVVALDASADVIARHLAEPIGDFTCLIPLHDMRPRAALRPADLPVLAAADVVVAGESAAALASPSLQAQAPAATVIQLRFAAAAGGQAAGDDAWAFLDVRRMIAAIDPVRDGLKAAAPAPTPAQAAAIDARADACRTQLSALDASIRARFSDVPAGRRSIITNDAALATFASACGLQATLMKELSPARQPTTADRDRLFNAIQRSGAVAIIIDPGGNDALRELLEEAGQRGPRIITADPWHLPAADPGRGAAADAYVALLTHWREMLAAALAR